MAKDARFSVVFVLGGPGAGKGTQCQKIAEAFGCIPLSAGELLRQERKKADSVYKDEIEDHIKRVVLVPVEITCALLKQAMEASQKDKFIIDGFPRDRDNYDGWIKMMSSVAVVRKVLFFNCPENVCIERCLDRGKTGVRDDDNLEILKKRTKSHIDLTMPIVELYKEQNLLVEINANQSADEVFADVKKVFEELEF